MKQTWTKFEEYKQQPKKFQELKDQYKQKVEDANTNLTSLEAQFESVIEDELKNGKSLTTQKGQLQKDIKAAKQDLELAEIEEKKMQEYVREQMQQSNIGLGDLVQDYNNNYRPTVFAKEVKPLLDDVKAARAQYLNALLDLVKTKEKYNQEYSQVRDFANRHYFNGNNGARPAVKHVVEFNEVTQLTDSEIHGVLNYRKLPSDVDRA